MPRCGSTSGAVEMRPRCGLEAEQPAAGGRDADRAGAVGADRGARPGPAATAVALPPLEPPRVRCRSHGLRVTPYVGDSVKPVAISSGTCVLPMITAPAARSRRTTSESAGCDRRVAVAAVAGDLARDVDVVLDRDRHAQQRARVSPAAAPVGLVGLDQRLLAEARRGTRSAAGPGARSGPGRARSARARRARRPRSGRRGGRGRRRRGRRDPWARRTLLGRPSTRSSWLRRAPGAVVSPRDALIRHRRGGRGRGPRSACARGLGIRLRRCRHRGDAAPQPRGAGRAAAAAARRPRRVRAQHGHDVPRRRARAAGDAGPDRDDRALRSRRRGRRGTCGRARRHGVLRLAALGAGAGGGGADRRCAVLPALHAQRPRLDARDDPARRGRGLPRAVRDARQRGRRRARTRVAQSLRPRRGAGPSQHRPGPRPP